MRLITVPLSRKNLPAFLVLLILLSVNPAQSGNWSQHQGSLNGAKDRVTSKEAEIAKLATEKVGAKPETTKTILAEILKKQLEIKEIREALEKEREHVRFEHPERGAQFEKVIVQIKPKTLEEIQSEVGLEKRLSTLRMQVAKTYLKPSPTPNPKITIVPTPSPTPRPIRATPTPTPGPKLSL